MLSLVTVKSDHPWLGHAAVTAAYIKGLAWNAVAMSCKRSCRQHWHVKMSEKRSHPGTSVLPVHPFHHGPTTSTIPRSCLHQIHPSKIISMRIKLTLRLEADVSAHWSERAGQGLSDPWHLVENQELGRPNLPDGKKNACFCISADDSDSALPPPEKQKKPSANCKHRSRVDRESSP